MSEDQPFYPDGTVLFISCTDPHGPVEKIAVRVSGCDLTHAVVLFGSPNIVYEQTFPHARKLTFPDWLEDFRTGRHSQSHLFLMVPNIHYTPEEVKAMTEFAEGQMGRRYMARGAWQHRETRGSYCSQFVSEVLEKGGRVTSLHEDDLPGKLLDQIKDWSHRIELST